MTTSELIQMLQNEMQQNGDKQIIIAANRHSYYSVKVVTSDNKTTLALFDKVEE